MTKHAPAWLGTESAGSVIAVSIWLATLCNIPLWKALLQLPENAAGGVAVWTFLAACMVLVAALNAGILSVIAWGPLRKPVLTLFILVAAASSYFMLAYGVVIDAGMATNVLQTDVREVRDLLDIRFALALLALAAPPLWWIWRMPPPSSSLKRQLLWHGATAIGAAAVAVASLLLAFQPLASTMRNHKQLRYLITPLNTAYALGKTLSQPRHRGQGQLQAIAEDARLKPSPEGPAPLILLVVGETARAKNFAINGYERNTNPQLAQRSDLFSSRNAWSCGTSTAESLPCMFSPLGRKDFRDRSVDTENLLDVLQRAGLAVLWLDNQSGCKEVCRRIETQTIKADPSNRNCSESGDCPDTTMLLALDERIGALPAQRRERGTVVVMHQMGSHGPAYYKRADKERKVFLPECMSAALQSCSREEVRNAYDNSIVETDYFLSQTIQWLQEKHPARPTAMLYVSDHGESLGEGNLYLHGLPYAFAPDVQKQIPWILWMSPAMQRRLGLSMSCLQSQQDEANISHDNYFHTVLGALQVQTRAYIPDLDFLSPCRS